MVSLQPRIGSKVSPPRPIPERSAFRRKVATTNLSLTNHAPKIQTKPARIRKGSSRANQVLAQAPPSRLLQNHGHRQRRHWLRRAAPSRPLARRTTPPEK